MTNDCINVGDDRRWSIQKLLALSAGTVLFVIGYIFSPLRESFEQSLIRNVLVGFPFWIGVGWYLAASTRQQNLSWITRYNHNGIAGILVASFAIAFWMIPRWLDTAIDDGAVALLKYLTLIFVAGYAFGFSWRQLHPIGRALLKIELLSMLFRLGWLYLISPVRLCTNYRLDDQILLGKWFLGIGACLSLVWLAQVFFADHRWFPQGSPKQQDSLTISS